MHNVEPMPVQSTSVPRPSDNSRTREGRRLDLDVVRGLAIVLALGWHFSGVQSGNVVLDALTWPGRSFGWAGVDLFFVLSGFLLGRLVLTEQARTGRFDGRRFTARRLLKLWPVLYLFLAVQALAGPEPATSYLWQNALHVQNYAGTSLTHLWSLAVEEHFYLGLAILFPLFARRRGSPRLLAAILVGILVAALAFRHLGRGPRGQRRPAAVAHAVPRRLDRRRCPARPGERALAGAVRPAAQPSPAAAGRAGRRDRPPGDHRQDGCGRQHGRLHGGLPDRCGPAAPAVPRRVDPARAVDLRADGPARPLLVRHLHLARVRGRGGARPAPRLGHRSPRRPARRR